MPFECPLYVPIAQDPNKLTAPRDGEGNRSWSAGASAGSLTTGIAETIWILQEIHADLQAVALAFLDWNEFTKSGNGLFLWEAFAPNQSKALTHTEVAEGLVRAFAHALPDPRTSNVISAGESYSLIGAALLHAGWSTDLSLLRRRSCEPRDASRSRARRACSRWADGWSTPSRNASAATGHC